MLNEEEYANKLNELNHGRLLKDFVDEPIDNLHHCREEDNLNDLIMSNFVLSICSSLVVVFHIYILEMLKNLQEFV